MGSTLANRKDAPGSLTAEHREKEREITEENQLIFYKFFLQDWSIAFWEFDCKQSILGTSLITSMIMAVFL